MALTVAPRFMNGSTVFNGTTSTIPTTLTANTAFTSGFVLHGWIKPRSIGEAQGRILDKSSGSGQLGLSGFTVCSGFTNKIQLSVNNTGTCTTADWAISFNRWSHFIAHVSADATVSFYINGVLSGTPAQTGALSGITTENPLTIGNRSTATDRTFDGNMAELGIISLAGRSDLTAEEIENLYRFGSIPAGATNFWTLGEPASPYADTIGANTGTGTDTTYSKDTPTQQRVSFQDGSASLSFDGVDDYVQSVSQNLHGATEASVTCRFLYKRTGVAQSPWGWADTSWDPQFGCEITTTETFRYRLYDGGTDYGFTTGLKLVPNTFYTATQTFSASEGKIKLYVNGQLWQEKVVELTELDTANSDLYFGKLGEKTQYLKGNIKSLYTHLTTLTHSQIQNLHFHGIVPREGLVGEWDSDNIVGLTIPDTSGQGNHATVSGAVPSYDIPPYMGRRAQLGAPTKIDSGYDGVVSGGVTIADEAMVFDGVDGRVRIASPPFFKNGIQTISLWFNTAKGRTETEYMLTQPVTGANANRVYIRKTSSDAIDMLLGSTTYEIAPVAGWEENVWNHILVVRDQTNSKAYALFNNVAKVDANLTTIATEITADVSIGWEPTAGAASKFEGSIGHVAIFNGDKRNDNTAIFNAGPNAKCLVRRGLLAEYSGRNYYGAPNIIFNTANYDGDNILEEKTRTPLSEDRT